MWQQCGDVACPVGGQSREDVYQIGVRVEPVELSGAYKAHDSGRALASAQRPANNQMI